MACLQDAGDRGRPVRAPAAGGVRLQAGETRPAAAGQTLRRASLLDFCLP
jgi:hypothetical protein